MDKTSITVIGAGVIGLAIAREISKFQKNVLLLDRNPYFGMENSARNSEVIHSGIYYPKNSLKAQLCLMGKRLLYEYCDQNRIPHRTIGKLVVATSKDEFEKLNVIEQQASINGVEVQRLNRERALEYEPNLQVERALFSPTTGIIDSHQYMLQLLADFEANGGEFVTHSTITQVLPEFKGDKKGYVIEIETADKNRFEFLSQHIVNAGGLGAYALAQLTEKNLPKIEFVKGNYFSFSGANPFNHLIYPIPDASGKGLGIHATIDLQDNVRFGPDIEPIQCIDFTVNEDRKANFIHAIQRYYPQIRQDQLQPGFAGIRTQMRSGNCTTSNPSFRDFMIYVSKESYKSAIQRYWRYGFF